MSECNKEVLEKLDRLDKSVSKLLNLTTKIAKTLHLVPVTEKEEKALQLLQRKNLEVAAKVNDELNAMENKSTDDMYDVFGIASDDVFNDVLGDDFLTRSDNS